MHNNCLYCAEPFRSRRATKKYCSGNCKQLAYFKRNGMVFGLNGEKQPEVNVKELYDNPVIVKDFKVKPDTVKQNLSVKSDRVKEFIVKQENTVKQNNSVKDDGHILRKENTEPLPFLSERQLQELVSRITENLSVNILQVIDSVKTGLDVKYSSLYAKEKLAQNTQAEVLSCSATPITDITKLEAVPSNIQDTEKQGSVKHGKEITIKPDVKDDKTDLEYNADDTQNTLTENEEHFTVNEDQPEKHLPDTIRYMELPNDDDENEDTDESEDENELYDKNNNVKDNSDQDTVKQDAAKQDNVKDAYIKELEAKLHSLTSATEEELLNKDKVVPLTKQPEEPAQEKIEEKYEWVQSKFYNGIEDFNERTEELLDESGSNENVNWVNVRLRCIIENVIRLSELSFIDRESLLRLNEVLNKIIGTNSFGNLPGFYLYTELIHELADRLNQLSKNKAENIPLRISLKSKAKLVSMQNQLRDFVPLIKFDEINFAEPHREIFNEKIKRSRGELSGLNKIKNSSDWKERHRQYVDAGLIEPDEDDEDHNEDENETDDEKIVYEQRNPYTDRLKYFERTGKFPTRLNN